MYNELLHKKINALKDRGQYREFITIDRIRGNNPLAKVHGKLRNKHVVVWSSNDYLGMSQHPDVINAMYEAIQNHGAGSGGSRNICGTHKHYRFLENSIAEWHEKENALVFPTGYSSNDATLQCLLRLFPDVIVFSDELNHASIINGIRSVPVDRMVFKHNDMEHLASLLKQQPYQRPKIIVFESVYSMDGDVAPVDKIVSLAKKFNALTFLDESHAIGIYGARGAGIASQLNLASHIDIIQGSMSKAIGVFGGYIAASNLMIDVIRSYASGFIFSTSLPPVIAAACYNSIEHLKYSNTERIKLHEKTKLLRDELTKAKIPVMQQSTTHILPVLIGNMAKCKAIANRLLNEHNIYLQPINAPTVPVGSERFRVNVTANHTSLQISALVKALMEVFEYFQVSHVARHPDLMA